MISDKSIIGENPLLWNNKVCRAYCNERNNKRDGANQISAVNGAANGETAQKRLLPIIGGYHVNYCSRLNYCNC